MNKRKRLKITLVIDDEYFFKEDPEFRGLTEPSMKEMEFFIANSLRTQGHNVSVLPFRGLLKDFIKTLINLKPDLVFNLVQHYKQKRRGEVYMPCLLDLLNIKYTGPDGYGIMLTIDKRLCKDILRTNLLQVPDYVQIKRGERINLVNLKFPLIIKPNFEGGSEGIRVENVVRKKSALKMISRRLLLDYESVLIESFIKGKEITIGLVEHRKGIHIFRPRELVFPAGNENDINIVTCEIKEEPEFRKRFGVFSRDLKCSKKLLKKITSMAVKAFRVLHLRDFARIDMRISDDGKVYIVDVNSNPTLKPKSQSLFAPWSGMPYNKVISTIIENSINR